MKRIANLLTQNYKVYQYGEDKSVPYRSDWDLIFRKKRSRKYVYRLMDTEILSLFWQLST